MKIFIYSPQREISQIISDHLTSYGNFCLIFFSTSELIDEIANRKKLPDLLILDYLSFNHDLFNIYDSFANYHLMLPVIFYNDPCLTRSTRTSHWLSQLETIMTKAIPRDFSIFRPVFKELEMLIESDELRPYIPLMQKPAPLPKSYIKDAYTLQYLKEQSDDCIYTFKERNNLPENLFYLLKLLQKHKELLLNYSEIKDLYEKDGKSITEKSICVLMSNLRKYIRDDKQNNFLIYQDKDRFRFVRFKI